MRNVLWLAALIAVPAGALVAVWRFLETTDWPAWLQAIGSIWAIGIAIWLSHRADSEQQRGASKATLALAANLDLRLVSHAQLCREDSEWELMRLRGIFDGMIYAARSIRLDLLPTHKMYHYLTLLNQLSEASFLAHRAAATGASRQELAAHFERLREDVGPVVGYLSLSTVSRLTWIKSWVARKTGREARDS